MKTVLLAGAATLALGCSNGERGRPASDSSRSDPAQSTATAGGQVQLKLPSGFTATVFAENLGSTRHLAAGPGGTIYANTWHSPYDTTRRVPAGGYLVALRDTNGDGRADVIRRFGSTSESGSNGVGSLGAGIQWVVGKVPVPGAPKEEQYGGIGFQAQVDYIWRSERSGYVRASAGVVYRFLHKK